MPDWHRRETLLQDESVKTIKIQIQNGNVVTQPAWVYEHGDQMSRHIVHVGAGIEKFFLFENADNKPILPGYYYRQGGPVTPVPALQAVAIEPNITLLDAGHNRMADDHMSDINHDTSDRENDLDEEPSGDEDNTENNLDVGAHGGLNDDVNPDEEHSDNFVYDAAEPTE